MDLLLSGRVIGVTAERRSQQQQRFLEARGASVELAPVLATADRTERPEVVATTLALIDAPPDLLVVQTGQGFRWWLSAIGDSAADALLESLGSTDIWCRGPKATSAVRKVGLDVAWQSGEETTADVARHLNQEDLGGKHVVIQVDGNDPEPLRRGAADASSLSLLNVYRYLLPSDLAPALALIDRVIAGSVDAVTFTASPAIRHLRQIASLHGTGEELDAAFSTSCLAAVVGPVCAETARQAGWSNVSEPPTARLIPMLEAMVLALRN